MAHPCESCVCSHHGIKVLVAREDGDELVKATLLRFRGGPAELEEAMTILQSTRRFWCARRDIADDDNEDISAIICAAVVDPNGVTPLRAQLRT